MQNWKSNALSNVLYEQLSRHIRHCSATSSQRVGAELNWVTRKIGHKHRSVCVSCYKLSVMWFETWPPCLSSLHHYCWPRNCWFESACPHPVWGRRVRYRSPNKSSSLSVHRTGKLRFTVVTSKYGSCWITHQILEVKFVSNCQRVLSSFVQRAHGRSRLSHPTRNVNNEQFLLTVQENIYSPTKCTCFPTKIFVHRKQFRFGLTTAEKLPRVRTRHEPFLDGPCLLERK